MSEDERWDAPVRPATRAGILRALAGAIVIAVALGIPLVHYLWWASSTRARDLQRSGHTVTVTRPQDVRVQTVQSRYSLDVVHVSVRLDGAWRTLANGREDEHTDLPHWYSDEGTFEPLPATAFYPPLVLRVGHDMRSVMLHRDYEKDLADGPPPRAMWAADALAAVIAVVGLRWAWGRYTRAMDRAAEGMRR